MVGLGQWSKPPEGGIDTRVFGSSRAKHIERNTKLKTATVINIDDDMTKQSLCPCGKKYSASEKRKKLDGG